MVLMKSASTLPGLPYSQSVGASRLTRCLHSTRSSASFHISHNLSLSIPLHRPIAVLLAFLVISPLSLPYKIVPAMVHFTFITSPNHLNLLFRVIFNLNSVQRAFVLEDYAPFCNNYCRWDRNRLSSAMVLRYYQWICSPIWPCFRFDRCTFIYPYPHRHIHDFISSML